MKNQTGLIFKYYGFPVSVDLIAKIERELVHLI